MRRAVAALVAVAAVLPAPSVAAAAGRARPAVGGGSFNDAPILEPGRYRDTILPGEILFYGVRLAAGQRLRLRLRPQYSYDEQSRANVANLGVQTYTPMREDDANGKDGNYVSTRRDDPIDFTTPIVSSFAVASDETLFRGPGIWYFSPSTSAPREDPVKIELPFTFEIAVMGQPQPEPAGQEAVPASQPTPAPTATPAATMADDEAGSTAGIVALIGVLALLAGAGLGAGARRLQRAGA